MNLIDETVLHKTLRALLAKVWESAPGPATSLGLSLYGHGGQVNILLNFDDDQSFQVEAIEYFQSGSSGEFVIKELESWVSEGEDFVFVNKRGEQVGESGQEAYEACFSSLVEGTKAWLMSLPEKVWRPHNFVFEDRPVLMEGGLWQCPGGVGLPPRPQNRDEPLSVNEFKAGQPEGMKIYSVGSIERKYCGLYLDRDQEALPLRNGEPVRHQWPEKVKASVWASHTRKGELAQACGDGIAVRNDAHEALLSWLEPYSEFLPVVDEDGDGWNLIHLLGDSIPRENLSEKYLLSNPPELSRNEWLDIGKPIFRGIGGYYDNIFVVIDGPDIEVDFFRLCRENNLRGLQYNLVWCEDTGFLRDRLHEAAELARDSAEKYSGSRRLTGPYSEFWSERAYKLHQWDLEIKHHSELQGREGWLSSGLWRYYRV